MTPKASDTENASRQTTVFFDGSCPLCRAEIAYYKRRDTGDRLRLVDVSAASADLPDGLDRGDAMRRFHVLGSNGHVSSGAAAFAQIWQVVPGWRRVGRIAAHPIVRPGLELGYRAFLVLRPTIVRAFSAVSRLKGARASSPKARDDGPS